MNRITRAVVCAVPAVVGQLLLAAPALADGGSTKPLQTAWYWYRPADASPVAAPSQLNPASDPTTPAGGLPVSANPSDGTTTKQSFVAFDLSAIPPTATVDSFVMTASVVDPNTQQTEPPKIVACISTRTWIAGEALPWGNKPAVDCTAAQVAGVYDATLKNWTFDLTPLAGFWLLGGNTGIGLLNDPTYKDKPYQVVFDSTKIRASVAWTPAVVTQKPEEPQVPQPQSGPPPTVTGGTGSLSGSSGTITPSTVDTVPQVQPQPQPQVANPGPVVQQVALARVPIRAAGGVGAGFWVAAVAIAAMLMFASWLLGDTRAPEPTRPGDSKLDRALRARRQGGTAGPARRAGPQLAPLRVRSV